jgi:L-fuculose-phosphate aldolase
MMTGHEDLLRREIARVGRLLYERGLIVAGDGNISVRLGQDLLLTTPSGACRARAAGRRASC